MKASHFFELKPAASSCAGLGVMLDLIDSFLVSCATFALNRRIYLNLKKK
jgi:hypothetical protein